MRAMLSAMERQLTSAAAQTPFAAVQMLAALGAGPGFLADLTGAGDIATAGVDLSADGSSWTWGGPTRRLLVGVRDEFGELIDIAALASHARDEWALLTGDGWALGMDRIAAVEAETGRAVIMAEPGKRPRAVRLRLYSTPLDWLAHNGEGICVLDWGHGAALSELRHLGEHCVLEVDPAGHDKVRGLLAWGGLPRVESARRGLLAWGGLPRVESARRGLGPAA